MNAMRWVLSAALLLGAFTLYSLPAAADWVQLANGDVLNGRVLSLDDKQLRLESDTLGQIILDRVKVVTISLETKGEPKKAPATIRPQSSGVNPDDVLKQLKTGGVNAKDIGDLQKMFPLLASPEASNYFNDTVKGLMGGSLSVSDIRKDAIRARDELKKATKGLGPDVDAAVSPYLMILEKFIGETEPGGKKAGKEKK